MKSATVLTGVALAATMALAAPALAENLMHPTFVPLDEDGKPAVASERPVSPYKTCGACHDTEFITAHDNHAGTGTTCIQCHVEGGRLVVSTDRLDANGMLKREAIRISRPTAAQCGACHGAIGDATQPVLLPPDILAPANESAGAYSLTWGEGSIVSPQPMSSSFLNLAGKTQLTTPWDVHAAKLVSCAACHHAQNDPARVATKKVELTYLKDDPRRPSVSEFLRRPDHRLQEPDCRTCHDPLAVHDFLPYRQRHMQVLACESCHIPEAVAPVAEMIDETVVTTDGAPVAEYRNVDQRGGESLNTAVIRPFSPPLLLRPSADGGRRLAPMNVVARWRWVSEDTGKPVALGTVRRALLEDGRYASGIIEMFDANHDGAIEAAELRLDTTVKTERVAQRLRILGVARPVVQGTLELYPFEHGVQSRERAVRACTGCHGDESRVGAALALSAFIPANVMPAPRDADLARFPATIGPGSDGGLRLTADRTVAGPHVLGRSRHGWSNALGFWLTVATVLGCLAHGLGRFIWRRRHAPEVTPKVERELVFGLYERVWHWIMALSVVLLILTGLAIHTTGAGAWGGLATTVSVHNVFAVVLSINAFLAFFYHVATAAIRQFLPEPRGLVAGIVRHLDYYGRGIFFGAAHPANDRKLNPLQQLTYLALLNILFPLQIGTGILIWAVGMSPALATALGGLGWLAPLHNLGAWLLIAFFVLHVYLTTTGRTLTTHVSSMLTGYAEVEPDRSHS